MQVALSTHSVLTVQAISDLLAQGGVAICPMVTLRAESWIWGGRDRIGLLYGGTCGQTGVVTGEPVCMQTFPHADEDNELTIGLGQAHLTSTHGYVYDNTCDVTAGACTTNSPGVCNSREASDLLPAGAIQPPTSCGGMGTENLVQWFEVPVSHISASLKDPPEFRPDASRVKRVDVLIFTDLRVSGFSCPSGIDVTFRGIDPSVGRVQRFSLFRGDVGLTTRDIFQ